MKEKIFEQKVKEGNEGKNEESIEASPPTKVAIIAPRDEHRSKTHQIPICKSF